MELSVTSPDMNDLRYKVETAITGYHQGKSIDLDFLSFCKFAYAHPEVMGCVTMIRGFFQQADTNNDNLIDKNELTKLIIDLSGSSGFPLPDENQLRETVTLIFETFDTNKDGFIDFPEFTKYYLSKPGVIPPTIPCFTLFVLGPMTPIGFDTSLLNELMTTENKKVEVVNCTDCNAPLVGKDGVQKFGLPFCGSTCMSHFSNFSDDRNSHRQKFFGNFRAITYDDYGWKGVGSKLK